MDKTNKILISISAVILVIIVFLIVLSMNKKPLKYTITFDSTGGSLVLDQTVFKKSKALKPADPTKEGYMFIEWQYNNKPYDFNMVVTSDLILKAVWKELKENTELFTVEFDSTGGSLISKQIIEKGEKATKPENPIKKNYKFIEWTKDDKLFDFEEEITENIKLIAKWEKLIEKEEKTTQTSNQQPKEENKKEYTVTFNSNGGSEISNQVVTENDTILKPDNPTKTGYKFNDWLLDNDSYNFNNPVNSNITLIASWIPNNYVVAYNINTDDGEGYMENTTCEYGKECSLQSNNYLQENYTFLGWSTSSDGTVTYSNNSQVLNLTSIDNGTVTLYAIWQLNE